MTITQMFLVVGLTATAGLQRFAVSYGYQGESKEQARENAYYAMLGTFCASVAYCLIMGAIFR